ncbi:type VI secretion system tube protein Hcp [Microbacterium sp. RU33B]|uniref:type VI secretion system tube protein Hcp n=1 Tax=Microbacterium sp. RU33B TaxID=1907390 RepID=UPI0009649C23|nr:type VI secretion system tube protein Hcp [Microbacterium sp. RU33B]SIT86833.1 Type VI protein secretion system component Hcp (secreted cytotoxin) [Microbacterium sp. RU33B]
MVDIFLQLPGIPGPSSATGHEQWIELTRASWGVDGAGAVHQGGGAGRGRATPDPLVVTAPTSTATPLVFEAIVTGRRFAQATLEVVRPGQVQHTAIRWEFADVQLTALDVSGAEPGFEDVFRVEARRARVAVIPPHPRGGESLNVTRGWDFAQSRPW